MHLCHQCNVGRKLEISNKLVCPICQNSAFLGLVYDILIAYDPTNEIDVLQAISTSFKKFSDTETGSVPIGDIVEECRLIAIEFRSIHLYDELTAMMMSYTGSDMNEIPVEEIEEPQNQQDQGPIDNAELLYRNYNNLEDFLSLIDIVKQQTKLSSEDIGIEIKRIKRTNPELSDLQSLYYVSCKLDVFFFEEWQRIAHATYDGTCFECDQKIFKDDNIFWNPKSKKTKHFDCKTIAQSADKTSKLYQSASEKFASKNYDDGMKILDSIRSIKFGSIFEHDDLSKTLISIFENPEKFNEIENKIDASKLMDNVNDDDFSEFKIKYESEFIKYCNSETSSDISQDFKILLRNNPEKESLFTKLVQDKYRKVSLKTSYFLDDNRNNKIIFEKIIKTSGKTIFFVDPYIDSRIINYVTMNFPSKSDIKHVKILSSLKAFDEIKYLEFFKQQVDELKNYFDGGGVKLEVKVYCGFKKFHDRHIYGDMTFFNLGSGMYPFIHKDPEAVITTMDSTLRNKIKEHDENRYAHDSCYDIFECYEKIKTEVKNKIN